MRPAKHWYVEVADKSFLHPQSLSDQNVKAWTLVVLILAFSYKKRSLRLNDFLQSFSIKRDQQMEKIGIIQYVEMIMIMVFISIYAVAYTHYTRIGNPTILFFSSSSLHFTSIRTSIPLPNFPARKKKKSNTHSENLRMNGRLLEPTHAVVNINPVNLQRRIVDI